MTTNQYIIITKSIDKWSIINPCLIFPTLDDNHLLQLIFLQKIKLHTCRLSSLFIILDDLDLDDFTLHPKLYNILKYTAPESYNIHLVYLDDSSTTDFNKMLNDIKSFSDTLPS